MGIITLLIFIACPIAAVPFIIMGLRKKDGKHKAIYFAIIAIFLALFSFHYQPTPAEDLYRHHLDTIQYEGESLNDLVEDISTQPEQLSLIYKYVISKTGNENFLQFFTAIMCYVILLYLLDRHGSKNNDIATWKKVGIWLFVLSGFHFLVITSGIFYTLALELFSLAVYLDYEKKKKITSKVLYILPVFIHTCAVLPLVIVIMYKILGSKLNLKNILILSVSVLSIGFIMTAIAPSFDIPVVNELSKLYTAYFNNEDQWSDLHSPLVLTIYLSRMVPIVIGYFLVKNKEKSGDFSLFMALLVILLFFQTTFSIRYIHIVVLCGLPVVFQAAKHERLGKIYSMSLYLFALPHLWYQLHQLSNAGTIKDIQNIPVTNIITQLFGGE